jgi:hypothetical protein
MSLSVIDPSEIGDKLLPANNKTDNNKTTFNYSQNIINCIQLPGNNDIIIDQVVAYPKIGNTTAVVGYNG